MMNNRFAFTLLAALLLTGCSGLSKALGKENIKIHVGPDFAEMDIVRDGIFFLGETDHAITYSDKSTTRTLTGGRTGGGRDVSGSAIVSHDKAVIGALGLSAIGVLGGALAAGPTGALIGGAAGAAAGTAIDTIEATKEEPAPVVVINPPAHAEPAAENVVPVNP